MDFTAMMSGMKFKRQKMKKEIPSKNIVQQEIVMDYDTKNY